MPPSNLSAKTYAALQRMLGGLVTLYDVDGGGVYLSEEDGLSVRRVAVRETLVTLSAKEFELLVRLASEPYRVFTKEELLREVWGFRALGRTRTLESHASRLRRKLNLTDTDHYIVNVWGVGYRLLD